MITETTAAGWRATVPGVLVAAVGALTGLFALTVIFFPGQGAALVVVATLVVLAAIIVGKPRKFLLAIILLELPFAYDVYLFYKEEPALLGAIGGLNLSITTFALAALYALWVADTLLRRKTGNPLSSILRTNRSLLVYVAAVTASIWVARDQQLAAFEVAMLAQVLLLFIYVVHSTRSRGDVLFVISLLMLGLVLESLVMLPLPLLGESVSLAGLEARIDAGGRVAGTIGSPNTAGAYLSFALAPALSILLTNVTRPYKLLAGAAVGLGCMALILTGSRGGWLALLVAVSILGLFAIRSRWMSPFALVGGFLCVMFVVAVFAGAILPRVLSADSAISAHSRVPLMQLASRFIEDNFLLGVGANNFGTRMESYTTGEIAKEWLYTVHNKYLLVWAETGVVALLSFVAFMVVAIRRGWRMYCENDPFLSPLALGLMAGIIGRMIHMGVDLFNSRSDVEFLWLVAALLAAMEMLPRRATPARLPTFGWTVPSGTNWPWPA